jgi:hypothetical protein
VGQRFNIKIYDSSVLFFSRSPIYRSYYMERKIFQHLLELKSLQIRSCKSNEAVLVKRAVDDYHKSVADLGFEVGGTLSRYQMREYTFKNFELFLYETLKSLQKPGTFNFQNIGEVYREVCNADMLLFVRTSVIV